MASEKFLARNEHTIDRLLRVCLGIALLALVVVGPKSYWGLLGLVPLATGLIGSCPLYTVLGISTCRVRGTNRADIASRDAHA
jgi:hypothetical protein